MDSFGATSTLGECYEFIYVGKNTFCLFLIVSYVVSCGLFCLVLRFDQSVNLQSQPVRLDRHRSMTRNSLIGPLRAWPPCGSLIFQIAKYFHLSPCVHSLSH